MKKLVAIALLGLMLFNLVGYQAYFYFQEQTHTKKFVARLDEGAYNDADLVRLSIPLSLPYISDNDDFERVDGQITYKGKIYKYVKRKVTANSLVILCLKDEAASKLSGTKNRYYSGVADAPAGPKKEGSGKNNGKNIGVEFLIQPRWQLTACAAVPQRFRLTHQPVSSLLPSPPQGQPPEAIVAYIHS